MKKHKIFRLVFWLSFLPYVYLIGYSLYHAIFGYDVYTWILPVYVRTVYGWGAFSEAFIWTAFAMCIIPVIPICLIYQIIYFIRFLIIIKRSKGIK